MSNERDPVCSELVVSKKASRKVVPSVSSKRPLAPQTALVTGASGGIGADIARELGSLGANLVITARSADRLEALALELRERHNITVSVIPADLSSPTGVEDLLAAIDRDHHIDILVNNAGLGLWGPFVESTWADVERQLQVDLMALTRLTHHFAPLMKARAKGRIMNVASFLALSPCPDFAVYAAAKSYVLSLTEALDVELKSSGVRCFATCPGGTRTEFSRVAGQRLNKVGERSLMTSAEVARLSVTKMLSGRRTYIPGWLNVVSAWIVGLLPRTLRPGFMSTAMRAGVEKA